MTDKLRSLIRRARDLDRQKKQIEDELKDAKTEIALQLGKGTHEGTGGAVATIIVPAPSLTENEANIPRAGELIRSHVLFAKLFSVVTVHKPAKGFREIVRATLPEAAAEELIPLFEKPGTVQVRLS